MELVLPSCLKTNHVSRHLSEKTLMVGNKPVIFFGKVVESTAVAHGILLIAGLGSYLGHSGLGSSNKVGSLEGLMELL